VARRTGRGTTSSTPTAPGAGTTGDDAWDVRERPHRERDARRRRGGYTIHHPTDDQTTVFRSQLVVFAGEELGTGSSRDWAAKGTDLLGVRATIAESYERIFRDNLVGMGVLPLQFDEGDSWESLELDGSERVAIQGLDDGLDVNNDLTAVAERADGSTVEFPVTAQVGTPAAVRYVENGGILHLVLRRLLSEE